MYVYIYIYMTYRWISQQLCTNLHTGKRGPIVAPCVAVEPFFHIDSCSGIMMMPNNHACVGHLKV